MERLAAETTRVTAALTRDEGRLIALAKMLERPARLAAYSPAARAAIDQIERLAGAGRPVALLSAPGVDGVAWAALAHLASPKRRGPITVLDGPSRAEHDLGRWRDPEASPLRAAHGGSLVILDAHALPESVQSFLGAALTDDVGIIVTLPATVDTLVATGQMSERLADRLGDHAVALPTLADRAEDIRALALEHLGRIGVRLQSRPLGLDSHALAALLEHTWPGNEAELQATLLRASLITEGEVIGVRELDRIGFPIPRERRRPSSPPAPLPTRARRSGN
jgi:transcriptional regulator of acetoin/glycerol metabolism